MFAWHRAKSDVTRASFLGPLHLSDLIIAAAELAYARYRIRSSAPIQMLGLEAERDDAGQVVLPSTQITRTVERVAFAVPRVAARLPWRADCLVQALAARRWLRRKGIKTKFCLGVRNDPVLGSQFHAWLKSGDTIVTGGNISGYIPFQRDERLSE